MATSYLDFPFHIDGRGRSAETAKDEHIFHIDGRGRSAETAEDEHIRDLIYQVLFTNPGERVNRPDFGCGIGQLVFMPNSDALAAATQFLVQGALTRWLDPIIAVHRVEVVAADNALTVTVVFTKRS